MTTPGDMERRDKNLTVIRSYLNEKFPKCDVEDKSDKPVGHWFTVTDLENHKSFKLWIDRARLEDGNYTPDLTKAALYSRDIAYEMKTSGAEGYHWHPDNSIPE
jgi:hypothetical protein